MIIVFLFALRGDNMNYNYNLINLGNIIDKKIDEIKEYFRFNGIKKFDENDIKSLCNISTKINSKNDFNVSYNIERLDKEFDLIKYGNDIIVNIELKLSQSDVSQCEQNYKILKNYYPYCNIYIFCYEENNDLLLIYNDELKCFEATNFNELNTLLDNITVGKIVNINFDVDCVYINPDYFLNNKYNLSNGQQITKNKILAEKNELTLVSGRAGTGKTLLALDLYNHYKSENKEIIYLTPFKLNSLVNSDLRKKVRMMTIKDFLIINKEYDIAIIDEAQRLKENDINDICSNIREKVILFGDINQVINSEHSFNELYEDKSICKYNLNQVIRTDDTFDYFAKKILHISTKGIKNKKIDLNKIKVYMYDDGKIPKLSDYIYIEPGQSRYFSGCYDTCKNRSCKKIMNLCNNYKTTYDVIGQEYNKVVIYFCKEYYLDKDNNIVSDANVCYGNLEKQLYTLITRTVNELIIIVEDISMYNYFCRKKEEILK